MIDNKELFDGNLDFEDDINYDGLDDFDESAEIDTVEELSEQAENEVTDELSSEKLEEITDNQSAEPEQDNYEEVTDYVTDYEPIDSTEEDNIILNESYKEEFIDDTNSEWDDKPEKISVERENITVNRFFVINTAISAITLCAVAAGIAVGYNYIKSVEEKLEIKTAEIEELEKKNELLEEDYIEAMSNVGDEQERISYDEIETEEGKISSFDSSVGYSWIPVLSDVKKNDYNNNNFVVDNRGRISYSENGEESSYFGIDVSSYQGDIDWQLVKEDNVEFAFLRIGYRGYGEEGKLCADEKFVYNYDAAHAAGIDLGVYFFSQATTVDEAVEEANYVLSLLENRSLEYPIVFDWETVQTGDPDDIPRTDEVYPKTLTLSAIAFCETIREAGYNPMIYTNKKLATIKYDLRMLQDYPIWLAYYDTNLNYCYDFDIWQYGTGYVDGIEGEVDVNIAMIK